MTTLLETLPLARGLNSRVPLRGLARGLNRCTAFAAKLILLLCLGISCAVSSMAFLLSVAIAMPVVTEQVGTWLTSGQWNPAPLLLILTRMGSPLHLDGAAVGPVADWVLSCESGWLIGVTASVFACMVWLFETARFRLIACSGS